MDSRGAPPESFDTARQIGTVYSLFVGEDLQTLLNGYVSQVEAMAQLFAAAGRLIEAQDEALSTALGKAAEEPAGLASLGLMGSLGSLVTLGEVSTDADPTVAPGYQRVGPEEVSTAPLERLVTAAQALEPTQYEQVSAQVETVATELRAATSALDSGLRNVLADQWQGEFAQGAGTSLEGFTRSADELADALDKVTAKAERLRDGYTATRDRIATESAQVQTIGRYQPGGDMMVGPVSVDTTEAAQAAAAAATEQARATVNTEYSPAVMDANLDDLDFPNAYRIVSTTALGGPDGVDLVNAWNTDGVVRPALATTPPESAIAAAGGGATGANAGGAGVATTSSPVAATDAATEQALLTSRTGADGGTGAAAAAGGTGAGATGAGATGGVAAGTGGGLNAATTAAAAPLAASATANQQRGGTGSGIIGRGTRGSGERDRNGGGFGNAAGLLGGGGAAAGGAGAAAARMGGAGTLAGLGGAAGMSGVPGTGSVPAGAFSSSSPGGTGAAGGRPGMMPMGMMGGAAAGQGGGARDGHRHASYLVNATNTSAIIGDPPKASPAIIGRRPESERDSTAVPEKQHAPAEQRRPDGS